MATPKRPVGVTIVAVVNIIFGVLGLCGGAFNIASNFGALTADADAPAKPANPADPFATTAEMQRFLVKELPEYKAFLIGSTIGSLATAILAIVSGLGLLKLKKWGRGLGLLWVALTILFSVAGIGYNLAKLAPAVAKWEEQRNVEIRKTGGTPPPAVTAIGIYVGVAVAVLFNVVYPLIAGLVLMSRSAKDAFSGVVRRAPADDEGWGAADDRDRDRDRDRDERRTEDDGEGRYRERRDS